MDKKGTASKEAIISTFDRVAANLGQLGARGLPHFGRRLVEMCNIAPGSVVLDVATGRGAVLIPAARQVGSGGHVTAIDLSAAMVRETTMDISKAGLANIDIRRMDAEALEFPDASFDWVLSGFALWFFAQPDRALAEFFRVLRPGGRLGISTWEESSQLPWDIFRMIEPHLPPGYSQMPPATRYDRPAQLTAALQKSGFEAIDIRLDEAQLFFENEEILWSSVGASGLRRHLDALGPVEYDKAKAEVFEAMCPTRQTEGIPVHYRMLAAFGAKPGDRDAGRKSI